MGLRRRTGQTVSDGADGFSREAHSISRSERGLVQLAELGGWGARGCGEGRFFPGRAFYIAKREWIRPIGRIGRIRRIGRIGALGCGEGRFFPGSAFYIAKRERIRPIRRIGRIARMGAVGRGGPSRTGRTAYPGKRILYREARVDQTD